MIKIKSKLILLLVVPIAFIACNDKENEDVTQTVDKNGSVETAVHITHIDSSRDVLITDHKVWVKNNLYKTVEYRDTIPALGIEHTTAENEDGDTKNVFVPKDYEIYITVK
jgi:hypothetical protein